MPFDRRGGTVPRRLAAAAVALLPGAGGARAQRTESLSSKANDPIAPLTQILFRNEATLSYYDRDTTGDGVRFRATIPFRAWRRDNLLRVDLPFGVGGAEGRGLRTIQVFDLAIFEARWSLSVGDMVLVFDWAREQWTSLPASLELAVVPKLLGQPVRFGLNPIYDLRELPGNEHWKINLALTILAPPATRGATAAGGGGNEATARPRR